VLQKTKLSLLCLLLNLPQLDEEINADIFTPRIRPCLYKDLLFTAIVWPDAIPIALPEVVDILIVHRDINDKKKDVIVLPLQSVIPHLEAFPILEGASPYRLLKYDAPPQDLVDFFRTLTKTADKHKVIQFDDILETEVFSETHPNYFL